MKTWQVEIVDEGSYCIFPFVEDIVPFIENCEDGELIKITVKDMTEEEYNELPEFEG